MVFKIASSAARVRDSRSPSTYFISGDIFNHVTGGTLCDRMVAEELQRTRAIHFVIPQLRSLNYDRQLLAGLINNARNLIRSFPRGSLLFVDHGIYRDIFLAANVWKWLYSCRVIGLVYHLDYQLPEMSGGRALRAVIEKLLIRTYDYVLTISRSTADHLHALGHSDNRISQIPVSRRFGPQEYFERPPRDYTITLLFVGAVQPRKGLREAIQALGTYRGRTKIIFRCVGNYDSADAYAQELRVAASRVPALVLEMPGRISQQALVEELMRADAFLFPSHWEGYGIAIEEAMCFGLPVIAFQAGAVPELVEDGITGWLAPVGDIKALGHAIAQCVDDVEERRRRGRNGLEKARRLTAENDLSTILAYAIAATEKPDDR